MANDANTRIRDWLARMLDEKGVSQNDLALSIGLSPSAVSRILKGERQVSGSELVSAVEKFGTSFYDLDRLIVGTLDEVDPNRVKPDPKFHENTVDHEMLLEKVGLYAGDPAILTKDLRWIAPYEDRENMFLPERYMPSDGGDNSGYRWWEFKNDSMEPTIRRHDLVVFQLCGIGGSQNLGLFVIETDTGFTTVRRVDRRLTNGAPGIIRLSADNPRYGAEEVAEDHVRLIGEVAGIYHREMR